MVTIRVMCSRINGFEPAKDSRLLYTKTPDNIPIWINYGSLVDVRLIIRNGCYSKLCNTIFC